jgi:alpha-glucosidase (family GH31 glycosyl hydrolase)
VDSKAFGNRCGPLKQRENPSGTALHVLFSDLFCLDFSIKKKQYNFEVHPTRFRPSGTELHVLFSDLFCLDFSIKKKQYNFEVDPTRFPQISSPQNNKINNKQDASNEA